MYLKNIWHTKQLTDNAKYYQILEKEMADFLGVKYVSLFYKSPYKYLKLI